MVFLGLKVLFVLWILTLIQVASLRFLNPPLTATMLWARIQGENPRAHAWLTPSWRRLGRISPHLRKAVLAGEDQRFLSHHGFDFTEMNRAIRQLAMKKGIRGASTISMQVARTVFLWPARTWFRKLAEAYYTFLIEIFWTKQRILEMYLNTVDWGNGIRGAQAASERYFHVPARDIIARGGNGAIQDSLQVDAPDGCRDRLPAAGVEFPGNGGIRRTGGKR